MPSPSKRSESAHPQRAAAARAPATPVSTRSRIVTVGHAAGGRRSRSGLRRDRRRCLGRRPGRRRSNRRTGRRRRRGPASSAGRDDARRTSSARAAQNSISSARGSSSTAASFRRSRIRSPACVPPGSRSSSVPGPSASASSARLGALARAVDPFEGDEHCRGAGVRSFGFGAGFAAPAGEAGPASCGVASSAPACARPRPCRSRSSPRSSPLASASALRFSASSLAFWRSARFSRISTIEGQSSFRQRFQGRPRKPLTLSRGASPQIEQRSSSRQSS